MTMFFDIQRFADSPPTPPDGSGGGTPGGGSSSSSVTWSGATSITSATTETGKTYTSTSADQNAVLINTSDNVVLTNATVEKSGGSSASDNYSFYGINSAVMCKGGGTTSITGGSVTTSAAGANGIFSYGANSGSTNATGDGTTVYISNMTITTSGAGSGGIMTTYGGTTVAQNLTINTSGGSSAPIRTDRGGGWVTVTGGSYTSNGLGSPAIYSTADITVNDATLVSNLSEGVCIEGTGSIALSNCTLTANNTSTNGNAKFYDTIMIYQSMSGDADSGSSSFSMTGGVLNSKSGHVFHVTNTSAVITLDGVTINNTDSNDVLLSVCDDGWSGGSNTATLNASGQELSGSILVGSDSTLTLNLSDSSTLKGAISGSITNANGSTVSTSVGTVNVSLDSSSKWYLTEDTYISNFEGTAANVITNGYTLYENNIAVSGTSTSDSSDTISGGNTKLITGTSDNDTIGNTISGATIQGLGGNDSIRSYSDATEVSIIAGSGNDSVWNYSDSSTVVGTSGSNYLWNWSHYSKIIGGSGSDTIANDNDRYVSISGGAGADLISDVGDYATISGGAGADTIQLVNGSSSSVLIQYSSGDGNDLITGFNEDDTLSISGSTYSTAASGSDIIFTVGSNKITLSSGADLSTVNIAGTSTSTDTASGGDESDADSDYTINKAKTIVTLNSDFTGTFDLANYASTIKTVNASLTSGGVEIIGNSKANKLIGGSGSDTLNGSTGKDTLTGNDGADVFYYESGGGKDVITDYTEDEDSIIISGGYVSASSVKGSDVVLKVGTGTLTVKKGKSKELTVIDELGERTRVYGNDMFITDSDKAKVKAKSKIITIDASARTTAINITGSSKANTILGGSGSNTLSGGSGNDYLVGGDDNDKLLGGAGADTLISGGGNDTLTGGAGKDVFIYESGNDIITDYKTSQKDEIVLTNGTVDSVSIKGSNVIFTIGDGSDADSGQITVKSGKSQTITITDANGNTTSQKYTKSSSFIERDYWFAENDNFVTNDMDSIVKSKDVDYSIGKMYTSNELTDLAQNTQVLTEITYTKDNK